MKKPGNTALRRTNNRSLNISGPTRSNDEMAPFAFPSGTVDQHAKNPRSKGPPQRELDWYLVALVGRLFRQSIWLCALIGDEEGRRVEVTLM